MCTYITIKYTGIYNLAENLPLRWSYQNKAWSTSEKYSLRCVQFQKKFEVFIIHELKDFLRIICNLSSYVSGHCKFVKILMIILQKEIMCIEERFSSTKYAVGGRNYYGVNGEYLMNIIWHRNGLQINKSLPSFIKCSLPYRGGEG